MIYERDGLFERINQYSFDPDNKNYAEKIELLEDSINRAIQKGIKWQETIHLAYSGGVDSSLLLIKLLKLGCNTKAHTIGLDNRTPDISYAKQFSYIQKILRKSFVETVLMNY